MACEILDLRPKCLDLEVYKGQTRAFAFYFRDKDTKVTEPLANWVVSVSAFFRTDRGDGTQIPIGAVINGDRVEIEITAAHIAALGRLKGYWECDVTDPNGDPVTHLEGDVRVKTQVSD